jgi:hypothetical protein
MTQGFFSSMLMIVVTDSQRAVERLIKDLPANLIATLLKPFDITVFIDHVTSLLV